MPKRKDIKKILLIGSGPIVIGQACEFDYSGTQACKALREEGYKVVLINSNPATIMTDPEFAYRTYIEPINAEMVEKIIKQERPQALLPTMGGQTGLNTAVELAEKGILKKYRVELIGAKLEAIRKAEDRFLFKKAMQKLGLDLPESGYASTLEKARKISRKLCFPLIIRPAFTLGGTGGSIAHNQSEFENCVEWGISNSPISQVLIEQSVCGWKEYELEVMRDLKDNVVIICSIENFDPMGIHTGDSITVAPAQTLTDKEYQNMRNAAIGIIREIGVDTGGSNIQFAVNPENGKMVVIEMNPRVSRSSALASKATGFPIAKIAAKLAVGYTLDEIPNDITRYTPAAFEPTIDYVVTKVPRWAFEKFPGADATLTTQMKSVGEVMAIGRTFKESLQKALRSLEIDRAGLGADGEDAFNRKGHFREKEKEIIRQKLRVPVAERIFYLKYAIQAGISFDEIFKLSGIDRWFLQNLKDIVDLECQIAGKRKISVELLRKAKMWGFSDRQLAFLSGTEEITVRRRRERAGIKPVYKMVDTCAAEFEAYTPYLYSTYEAPYYRVSGKKVATLLDDEALPRKKKKIMILGGGPNRIGQGIEFDYCCVHGVFALKKDGYEVIMVNCNPETVSTDYDTSDRLYFEPLTFEDVMNIVGREKPDGVIVQFGGQTPLKLAIPLKTAGVKIIGTDPEKIDEAEDRKLFGDLLTRLKIPQAPNGTAYSFAEAIKIAKRIGYPVLVRPSYVLGGRAMELVYDKESLENYMQTAVKASFDHPVLVDKFLEDAIEVDVDAVADGKQTVIAGIMEHIEEAGIHSGDSACVLPPYTLSDTQIETIKKYTYELASALSVVGLLNIQFAIRSEAIYVLEVNPRASRTVPFVSKATGIPWAKVAARVMAGKTLSELGVKEHLNPEHISVKEAVLPFVKFPGVDIILGPEMKSTGEVMGIDVDFGKAYAKSQIAAGDTLPLSGTVFISVNNRDKRNVIFIAKHLVELGFRICSTKGTASVLKKSGIDVERINKIHEGKPNVVDYIKSDKIGLIINTPMGKGPKFDEYQIRRTAITCGVPCVTTMAAAQAVVNAIDALKKSGLSVTSLQSYHK